MVSLSVQGSICTIKVLGFHKFLALKNQIEFDKKNVISIKVAEEGLHPPIIKAPGTRIPGIITAGTYIGIGKNEFWDKGNSYQAIEIELKNELYTKIVVDIDDPEAAINLMKS